MATFKRYQRTKGQCDCCGETRRLGIHEIKTCDECYNAKKVVYLD
jgi:hypothetical protein